MNYLNRFFCKVRKFSLIIVLIAYSLLLVHSETQGDNPIGKVKPTKLSKLKFPPGSQWVYSGNGVPLGMAVRTRKGMTVSLNDGREFLFEKFGNLVIAEQAKSFVTIAPLGGEVATEWELAFYDAEGKRLARRKIHGFFRVDVAEKGLVAVAGTIKESSKEEQKEKTGIIIYDSAGKEISRRFLPGDSLIAVVEINPAGTLAAIGVEQIEKGAKKRWSIQVQDINGQVIHIREVPNAVQGMRFVHEDNTIIVLNPGGVRLITLEKEMAVPKLIRLPAGYYIPGPGHVFFKSGKLIVIAEKPLKHDKGNNVWYLLAADQGSIKMKSLAKGSLVRSGKSPGLSMSPELGAREWPVLVTPKSTMKLNLSVRQSKKL